MQSTGQSTKRSLWGDLWPILLLLIFGVLSFLKVLDLHSRAIRGSDMLKLIAGGIGCGIGFAWLLWRIVPKFRK
jgi:hypothetical protein